MSTEKAPPAVPSSEARPYFMDIASERDRLFLMFDAMREDLAEIFAHAVTLGGLSTDPESAKWRLLDVGCGEGLVSIDIQEHYPLIEIVAFDRDPESIATASSAFTGAKHLHFVRHDVYAPLPAEFSPGVSGHDFDFALLRAALTNFMDGELALRNVAAGLKPGGTMLLIDAVTDTFNPSHPEVVALWGAAMQAWRRFGTFDAGNQHARLLAAAGMEVVEQTRRSFQQDINTPEGRKIVFLMIETLRSLRRLAVDLGKVMTPAEYDERLARLQADAANVTGPVHFMHTIARKR